MGENYKDTLSILVVFLQNRGGAFVPVLVNPYSIQFLFPLTAEILSIRQSRYVFFIIPIH